MDDDKKNQWWGLKPKWVPEWLSFTFVMFVAFVAMMLFYGDFSYVKSNEYSQQIQKIQQEIRENNDTARIYTQKIQELNTDPETLERIAREKYGMKRENEDVYTTDIP